MNKRVKIYRKKKQINCFFTLFLFINLVLQLCGYGQTFQKAPFPNFKDNVDYVSWLRKQVACTCDNAINAYNLFPGYTNEPTLGFLKPPKEVDDQIDSIIHNPCSWDPNKLEKLNIYLKGLSNYIDVYSRVERKNYCLDFPEDTEHLIEVPLPHLQYSRIITRVITVLAWRQENYHVNSEKFAKRLTSTLEHSNYILQGMSFAEYLTGNKIREITYDSILAALNQSFLGCDDVNFLKEFLNNYDSNNVLKGLTDRLSIGPADHFDLIQDMTKRKLLSFSSKYKFGRKKVAYWLNLFGYFDGSFDSSKQPKFPDDILSENPLIIARNMDSYYTQCFNTVKAGFLPNYTSAFKKLRDEYLSGYRYFELFPLADMVKLYETSIQLERKRRIVHLALHLLDYYHNNKVFPDNLNQLQNVKDKAIIADPTSQVSFEYYPAKQKAKLTCPNIEVFSSISVNLSGDYGFD